MPRHRQIVDQNMTTRRAVEDRVAVTVERLHAKEPLQESEELFRQMADTIPEVI